MSPELLAIYSKSGFGEFNPEKSDIFSAGLTFLRLALLLSENQISGLNNLQNKFEITKLIIQIKYPGLSIIISEML